jgi:myosin heavy subunit
MSGQLPTDMSPLNLCTHLLMHFGISEAAYQVGKRSIFFRAGVLGQLEDRLASMQRCVLLNWAFPRLPKASQIWNTQHII